MTPRTSRRHGLVLLAACLAGCAGAPPVAPEAPRAPAAQRALPPDDGPAEPQVLALAAFERRHRELAAAAARDGRWADATWAWDVVLALQPRDATALRRRAEADAAAQAAAAERLPRARQAQQRGDLDGAARLYLEVLALQPEQAEAAEALRAIERERVQRFQLGQPARTALARRAPYDATVRPPGTARTEQDSRNEVEHASIMAAQGELDAAVALLQPLAATRRADPAARALLADLYVRQADRLAASDPSGAVATLEAALKLVPLHPQATLKLRQLRPAGGSAPRAPAAPR